MFVISDNFLHALNIFLLFPLGAYVISDLSMRVILKLCVKWICFFNIDNNTYTYVEYGADSNLYSLEV